MSGIVVPRESLVPRPAELRGQARRRRSPLDVTARRSPLGGHRSAHVTALRSCQCLAPQPGDASRSRVVFIGARVCVGAWGRWPVLKWCFRVAGASRWRRCAEEAVCWCALASRGGRGGAAESAGTGCPHPASVGWRRLPCPAPGTPPPPSPGDASPAQRRGRLPCPAPRCDATHGRPSVLSLSVSVRVCVCRLAV